MFIKSFQCLGMCECRCSEITWTRKLKQRNSIILQCMHTKKNNKIKQLNLNGQLLLFWSPSRNCVIRVFTLQTEVTFIIAKTKTKIVPINSNCVSWLCTVSDDLLRCIYFKKYMLFKKPRTAWRSSRFSCVDTWMHERYHVDRINVTSTKRAHLSLILSRYLPYEEPS